MFQIVSNLIGGAIEVAPPKDVGALQMTNAEAAYAGRAYRLASGRLTLASGNTQKDIAVIAMESAGAATPGATVRVFWITPGMVFKVPITAKDGTAHSGSLHGSIVVGATGQLNDTGTGLDGASDVGSVAGPLTILRLDATNKVAWVAFNTCLLSLDVNT